MDLRHARTFVTVAELGTVSKAALRLRIAQPALSRQIADLERELGLLLFDRIGRRLRLTGEGEQLLEECRSLLNQADAVGERAELLRRGDTGVLKIAASPQFIEATIAGILRRYSASYPNVQVRLFEAVGQQNLAMLERGEIHLAQNLIHTVQPNDRRFAHVAMGPLELLVASHAALSVGEHGTTEIGRLAQLPLLLLDGGFSVRRLFDAACRLAGVKPNILFESRAPHTLLALARASHGIAIIPSTLRMDQRDLYITRLTYRGRPVGETGTVFWDRRRPLPPYATAFCEMLAEQARQSLSLVPASGARNVAVPRRGPARRSDTNVPSSAKK